MRATYQSALVGGQTRIDGRVEISDDVHVDGHIVGSVVGDAQLTVGPEGVVEGEVHVRRLILHGVVVGRVAASDGVEVGAKAQVKGDIRTPQLTLQAGGRIAGQVKTGISVESARASRHTRHVARHRARRVESMLERHEAPEVEMALEEPTPSEPRLEIVETDDEALSEMKPSSASGKRSRKSMKKKVQKTENA